MSDIEPSFRAFLPWASEKKGGKGRSGRGRAVDKAREGGGRKRRKKPAVFPEWRKLKNPS